MCGNNKSRELRKGESTFFSTISHLLPIKILFTDSVACCSMFLIQFLMSLGIKCSQHCLRGMSADVGSADVGCC